MGRSARIEVTVLLFASLKECAKCDTLVIELGKGATVCDIAQEVARKIPCIGPHLEAAATAVNQIRVDDSHTVQDRDVVAFLPPVSGGCSDQDH